MTRFMETLDDKIKKSPEKIENAFRNSCKLSKKDDNRFVSSSVLNVFSGSPLNNFFSLVIVFFFGYSPVYFTCSLFKIAIGSSTQYSDERFAFVLYQCYYVGGLEESATGMLGEMSKPVSWGVPAEKICMKLYRKDAQICDIKYGW